jgi:hypothetical protein
MEARQSIDPETELPMTPALILNVILATVVLVAIVGLLGHSIHADRAAVHADA